MATYMRLIHKDYIWYLYSAWCAVHIISLSDAQVVVNGSPKCFCESLQTTQCRPFKPIERVKPTWEVPSIERVSLYERVKKSPWVLSLALFSGKMVPWAGKPTHSTSHNGIASAHAEQMNKTLRCFWLDAKGFDFIKIWTSRCHQIQLIC